MRSARRRALIEKRRKTVRLSGILLKVILPIILILGIFAFIKLSTKYWDGENKFAFAFRLENGDVAVSVLDPKLTELTTLVIPGDTQVEVAGNYGELRIKNVWQLGVNEKLGGSLLSATITQNFLFPVVLWSDSDAGALTGSNSFGVFRFIFFPKSTNIAFGDRISAGIFSLKVGVSNKNLLDLGKNQFLVKQKLNDSQMGYVLAGNVSQRLTIYFADGNFESGTTSGSSLRVAIGDATGVPGVADKVGAIIEVMGGKVVSINKKEAADTDCTVSGSNPMAVKKVASIFSCKVSTENGNFDLEIDLGQKFAKRF
ncbi:MAG: hypothetical protein UV71_C0014G0016 [Microgenomates group bacterium GW2011_GWC1_43_13]|uniref:LytR/CpsA/Psr regulator C-terminal domain-containing protein n=3 Tax=Candidatus Woeseibacteriota TaxID=1752722 RepID=A0A837I9P1_9BACT|nr:MAG: hypothetical protein UV71_C0014G0016 [Microgenomates group bacterium GW2011_GWC1_43_13]KKT33073.1 MAG: hypothetical protein UW20_C0005G0005 [Candidatus Woesebacteria bacterium GW2011_GWB1_44_11]KKT54735.1 MAG: hypothetical protein UW47_C0003G0004 [Candidatus Woesebacteria bacterium GW2011_GWA1_44_23]OGM76354.1 MAG: hypothetical protein A2208_01250 [Candidatus Woesebacteria bacterium RIFOXYA1_FULL_43_16]OGM81512.1 MAG: hypothetical protein A2394_00940 [Candidatus Woesebacteria bacterium 